MNNDWYEKGELPPVGQKCEFRTGNFWKPCEIKGEAFDYGQRIVLVQIGDAAKTIGNTEALRPLKSDREKAIEAAIDFCDINLVDAKLIGDLAAFWYDKGLLRLPESNQ